MPSPSSPPSSSKPSGWFMTFGFGQPLEGCFAWIPDAVTVAQAYEKAIMVYGTRYAFIYGREEYDSAIARFDVREVVFGTPND